MLRAARGRKISVALAAILAGAVVGLTLADVAQAARGGGGGGGGFHGGGGGFHAAPAFHGGGFRGGSAFRGGGVRHGGGYHRGFVDRPHFHHHRRFYGTYYDPDDSYYDSYPHHRRCRVVLTHYGPRRVCHYRPWHRHHWRHRHHHHRYW